MIKCTRWFHGHGAALEFLAEQLWTVSLVSFSFCRNPAGEANFSEKRFFWATLLRNPYGKLDHPLHCPTCPISELFVRVYLIQDHLAVNLFIIFWPLLLSRSELLEAKHDSNLVKVPCKRAYHTGGTCPYDNISQSAEICRSLKIEICCTHARTNCHHHNAI